MSESQEILSQAVQELVEQHGGLRKAARAIEVNYAYLSRLWNGEKSNPSVKTLRKMGLRRVITFERLAKS